MNLIADVHCAAMEYVYCIRVLRSMEHYYTDVLLMHCLFLHIREITDDYIFQQDSDNALRAWETSVIVQVQTPHLIPLTYSWYT